MREDRYQWGSDKGEDVKVVDVWLSIPLTSQNQVTSERNGIKLIVTSS